MTEFPLPECLIDYPSENNSKMAGGTAILTYNAMPVSCLIKCIEATQGETPVKDETWVLKVVSVPDVVTKGWALDGPDGVPLLQSQPRSVQIAGVLLVENVELRYGWTDKKYQAEQAKSRLYRERPATS